MDQNDQIDQGLWTKALGFHGSSLLQTILSEDLEDLTDRIDNDKLNMCLFIKNRLHKLFKPCEYSPSDIPPEPAIPTVPIDLFQDSSKVERRDLFFKSLDRCNILILRVINDVLQDNFKLLVICREDNCMKLDDLSLIMYLPKLKAELDLAGGELKVDDLIRAAVSCCSIDERKLFVTLDSNYLDDEFQHIKLGKISENDLPFYIGEVDIGSSYVEYLHQNPEFTNNAWTEDLFSYFDLKPKYHYSFIDDWDGKKYKPEECASELKKKQSLAISYIQYEKAMELVEVGNFKDAFEYLNKALKICPKNVDALISRATLYSNSNDIRQAFVDMEAALRINPNNTRARKEMSILLVATARLNIEGKQIAKARESLDAALNLDGNNMDAIEMIEEMNRKAGRSDEDYILEKRMFDDSVSSVIERKSSSSIMHGPSSSMGTSSKMDNKGQHELFLEASTKAFLSSLKRKYHREKRHHRRHRRHHHSRSKSPKSRSKSPKSRSKSPNSRSKSPQSRSSSSDTNSQ